MRKNMERIKRKNGFLIIISFVVSYLFIFNAHSAYALPTLKLSDGINDTIEVIDGGAGDASQESGVVSYQQFYGVFDIDLTVIGSLWGNSIAPQIELGGLIVSSGSGTLNIWFSEVGFGPTTASFITDVSGGTDGTASFNSYIDQTNALYGTGTSVGSISSISGNDLKGPFNMSKPYSMTTLATITHDVWGGATSFGMRSFAVPEETTMHLLGICIVGTLCVSRRVSHFTQSA